MHDLCAVGSLILGVERTSARGSGSLIAGLAAAAAAVMAVPGSWSDYSATTVYPLMVVPALVIAGGAGAVAAWRPGAARVAAVVGAVNGLQVAGIAVVASRDWLNFGGAGNASFERGLVGSRLALVMVGLAVAMVAASVQLHGGERPAPDLVAAGVVAAGVVTLLLCEYFGLSKLTAAGQFALWWAVPWTAGAVAALALPERAQRRAALASVAVSVGLTVACAAAAPAYGFLLRLPTG